MKLFEEQFTLEFGVKVLTTFVFHSQIAVFLGEANVTILHESGIQPEEKHLVSVPFVIFIGKFEHKLDVAGQRDFPIGTRKVAMCILL